MFLDSFFPFSSSPSPSAIREFPRFSLLGRLPSPFWIFSLHLLLFLFWVRYPFSSLVPQCRLNERGREFLAAFFVPSEDRKIFL